MTSWLKSLGHNLSTRLVSFRIPRDRNFYFVCLLVRCVAGTIVNGEVIKRPRVAIVCSPFLAVSSQVAAQQYIAQIQKAIACSIAQVTVWRVCLPWEMDKYRADSYTRCYGADIDIMGLQSNDDN